MRLKAKLTNWPLNVKGAKVLDMMADGQEPETIAMLLAEANEAVKMTYDGFKLNKFLCFPQKSMNKFDRSEFLP